MKSLIFVLALLFSSTSMNAPPELIIGEERVEPGIIIIFEGAVKDQVMPSEIHLAEDQTDVHIEARVNWDVENIPKGTPAGGFIPYLHITAKVTNAETGLSSFIDMMPHINLVDNFHYARNMSLPGKASDKYDVEFKITPTSELAIHKDWLDNYGPNLSDSFVFNYKAVDFLEIVNASRR